MRKLKHREDNLPRLHSGSGKTRIKLPRQSYSRTCDFITMLLIKMTKIKFDLYILKKRKRHYLLAGNKMYKEKQGKPMNKC